MCHGKYYISIYRSRKVAVCLLRAQQSEREMHVAMNGTDCVSEVTSLLKELQSGFIEGYQDQWSWLILPGEVFIVERLVSPAVVSC